MDTRPAADDLQRADTANGPTPSARMEPGPDREQVDNRRGEWYKTRASKHEGPFA